MTEEAPAAPAAAAKAKSGGSGCLLVAGALLALVVGGFIWNAITGTNGSSTRTVSRYTFSGPWPLTLDSVKIGCDGSNPWVLAYGDKFYALTGAGRAAGYLDIDPIWAYDPQTAGLKVNIAPLRAEAEKLC